MKKYIALIISLFSIQISIAQNDISNKIETLITSIYKEATPGISVLIAKNGKPIFRKAYGESNLELNTSMVSENVFQIGSITKQFTAVSILMLAEQGKINLEDPIETYIKDFPTRGKKITIHQLLNHTSGVKNSTPVGKNGFLSRKDMTSIELVNYFKNNPLDFEPGSRFKYSNAGYILLGRIIEVAAGVSYKEFLENRIFKKLNMNSSSYGSQESIIKNRAYGYQFKENKFVNADYLSLTLPFSAGAIMTTVDDLLLWHNALLNFLLIKKESLQKAMKPSALNNGKRIPYGYGWRFAKLNGSNVIAHTGSTRGFTSTTMFFPKEKIYIATLTNCNCKNIPDINKSIANIVLNKPTTSSQVKTVKIDSNKSQKFIGKYEVQPNVYITISYKDNSLFLTAPNQTKSIALFPENEYRFFMKVVPAKVTFKTNSKGKITGLILNQSGRKISASKI